MVLTFRLKLAAFFKSFNPTTLRLVPTSGRFPDEYIMQQIQSWRNLRKTTFFHSKPIA